MADETSNLNEPTITKIIDWKSKPWNLLGADIPASIFAPVGMMLGEEERRMLYYVAKNIYKGLGRVIDAGAFLGASTLALAAGVRDSKIQTNIKRPIVAYDYFKAIDAYVASAVSHYVRPTDIDDDYLDLFKKQTEEYADIIEARPGNFLEQMWYDELIEILFIDIAKNETINSHIILNYFPGLMPNHSFVIQQDYYWCYHPYIHICMEYLDEFFSLLDHRVMLCSRVWRLEAPIPPEKLQKCGREGFTFDEGLYLLDRLIGKSPPGQVEMMHVIKLFYLNSMKKKSEALKQIETIEGLFDLAEGGKDIWKTQFLDLKTRISPTSA